MGRGEQQEGQAECEQRGTALGGATTAAVAAVAAAI